MLEGNIGHRVLASGGSPVLARLNRITYRAEREASATFNNLYTLLTVELLQQAFCQLKRDKAPEADSQSG